MSGVRKAGITVRDVHPQKFVTKLSEHFKKSGRITAPAWADIVKTATFKQLPPFSPDWFYERAAAIARRIYLGGGKGVGTLARTFGGRAHRGSRPERTQVACRGLLRNILQQLEKADILSKSNKKIRTTGATIQCGRKISKKGQQELDRIANQVAVESPLQGLNYQFA